MCIAWLAACEPSHDSGGAIDVQFAFDRAAGDSGLVHVTGLTASERERVLRDPGALVVHGTVDSSTVGTPALAGAWREAGGELVFVPRFPPSHGVTIHVRADGPRLGRDSLASRAWRFAVPMTATDSVAPRVIAVHPSADTVPENLLRWYVEFSRAMRPGQALAHVRLIDAQGREDRTAFLDTSEELWDPSGRRLTLLFDPGRVKRGIRTNLEQGRPLRAGQQYRLRIEPGWLDVRGKATTEGLERVIVAVAADHAGPDAARWALREPSIGSLEPLVLSFGESLDHELALRLIAVRNASGERVDGEVALALGDSEWRFTPSGPWLAGEYQLFVSPELEDVAGNRPGRAFDAPAGPEVGGGAARAPITRSFSPRSADR